MLRARSHLIEHDLVTVPDDERIDVIATPEYLRNVIPFAAYFEPAAFDRDPKGIYVVTPSVGDDPNAMREHNFASISNTSIHEAYPGHHLQLDTARRHPSLTRLLTDAPEFVEGWGMYSELMMREQGFDADPRFRLMHAHRRHLAGLPDHPRRPDAPRRAERRGGDRLPGRADRLRAPERPRPRSSWYTYRPTYPLSYLLGRTLLLGLRADEQRRLGDRFSLKGVPRHAAAQRLAADQLPPPAAGRRGPDPIVQVIPAIDLEAGRSRIVYWPGAGGRDRRPDRPAGPDRRAVRGARRAAHPPRRLRRRPRPARPATSRPSAPIAARVAVPLQVAGGVDSADGDPPRLRRRGDAGRADHGHRRPARRPARLPRRGRRLAGGRPGPAAGAAGGLPVATAARRRPSRRLVGELVGAGVARFVLSHGGAEPDLDRTRELVRSYDAEILVAGGVRDLDGLRRLRDTGVAGVILGEALLSGAIDYPAALEAAA